MSDCAGSADSGTPSDQLGGGGAHPTSALYVSACEMADVRPWILERHYAKRMPGNVCAQFALREGTNIRGVITYGTAPTPTIQTSLAGPEWADRVWELNRLVVEPNLKNGASLLISKSLKMLPSPRFIVSYADGGVGHIGYVYQATNWLYIGAVSAHDAEYLVNGKYVHARTLTSRGITAPRAWAAANGIEAREPMLKHRYVFILAPSRRKRAEMLAALRYATLPYPKGASSRVGQENPLLVQGTLL